MANRLIHETSPYLLQHAHNPVDWYPWGPEAFAEAERRQVPILLSIGYAACHWCHVMERESFEDAAIAAQMNDLFVCVKVDREERPDVDELYMRAVQAFNRGHGGWPMTVFLTPDRVPFFGGTYFPPVTRGGMPGLPDILVQVSDTWRKEPARIADVTRQLMALLGDPGAEPSGILARDWLGPVAEASAADADAENGGFGGAPKFPPHGALAALLAHHRRTGDERSLDLVTHALDGMAQGGMHDWVGGGFCRYAVDVAWRIPHFEKMLYDTAQLVPLYVDAYLVTGRTLYARIARDAVGWVLREMRIEGGGFASSLDADSPGPDGAPREGAFYVFTRDELDAIGGPDALRLAQLCGVTLDGTFEHGASVIRFDTPLDDLGPADAALVQRALPALRAAREARPRPARDDKQIVAWNALMISALARGARALGEPGWIEAATTAFDALAASARIDGRWMRAVRDGKAKVAGFADDHANLLVATLDLWEATFDRRWLVEAEQVGDALLRLFWDEGRGALRLAGSDQEALIAAGRPAVGGAEPSPTAMAALGLVRGARLLDRPEWAAKAESLLRSVQSYLARAPRALGLEAIAGSWLAEGGSELAIVGRADALDTLALLDVARSRYLPFTVVARVDPPPVGDAAAPTPKLPFTEGKDAIGGHATAYVCEGQTCQLPTADPQTLADQLETAIRRSGPVSAGTGLRVRAPELPDALEAWLGTDTPLTLARLRGHVVVLDFWTYCCINCLHVLPELHKIEEAYRGKPVAVIGVHCAKFPAEEIAANVKRAMARHGVRHPVVHDPVHAIWEEYTVRSWPTVVVIDTEGRIALHQSGEADAKELGEVIDALLDEGRAGGTLADAPIPMPHLAADPGATLRFPGKVHVWPDAFEQEMGADPYDGSGRVYVSDTGHHRILECSLGRTRDGWPEVRVTRVFGSGEPGLVDGAGPEARFNGPQGVRRFESDLFVADTENHALRHVDLATGKVTTLAGTGKRGMGVPTRDELARPLALDLRSPWDVEVMPMRSHHLVFIAMAGSHQLWVYGAGHLGLHSGSGREDHVDGPAAAAALAQPSALALLGRYLLFADSETSSIRAVDLQSHQVVTVVGRGLFDFGDVDGKGDVARLQHPLGLTFIGDTVFVADTFNDKVRAIGLQTGETKTVCGGDRSVLDEPGGIARAGIFLLVADTNGHRLRIVNPGSGEVRDLPLLGPTGEPWR